jgi:hypothetical protein
MVNKGNKAVAAGFSLDLGGSPHLFGPAVDMGTYETQQSCMGSGSTEAVASAICRAAPNPVSGGDLFRVDCAEQVPSGTVQAQLWNMQGQLVSSGSHPVHDGGIAVEAPKTPVCTRWKSEQQMCCCRSSAWWCSEGKTYPRGVIVNPLKKSPGLPIKEARDSYLLEKA